MTHYRLPDVLGGARVTVLANNEDDQLIVTPDAGLNEGACPTRIYIYPHLLVEVPPPLPPVPDALAVVVGDHVFCRDDSNLPVFLCPGACHEDMTWEELNEYAAKAGKEVVPLVPAVTKPKARFFLTFTGGLSWKEVSQEVYLEEERAHGFIPSHGRDGEPATSSWSVPGGSGGMMCPPHSLPSGFR